MIHDEDALALFGDAVRVGHELIQSLRGVEGVFKSAAWAAASNCDPDHTVSFKIVQAYRDTHCGPLDAKIPLLLNPFDRDIRKVLCDRADHSFGATVSTDGASFWIRFGRIRATRNHNANGLPSKEGTL